MYIQADTYDLVIKARGEIDMKQIVCFGDSNTYGYIPENGERYPWGVRWTSLLNEKLGYGKYHIEEEGLCGRTTIFEDPLRDNRNGSNMLPALLETHQHADLIIVMLGTNDCKAAYGASAEMIGKGIEKIVGQIRGGAPDSKILLISPIWLGEKVWKPGYDPEFSEKSVAVSKHLAKVYRQIAEKENIAFLNAAAYAKPSAADQEHMDPESHRLLAEAIYQKVIEIEGILE